MMAIRIDFRGPRAKPGDVICMTADVNNSCYQVTELFPPEEEPFRQEHMLRMFTELMQEVYKKEIKDK